jgi:hypothetical protein
LSGFNLRNTDPNSKDQDMLGMKSGIKVLRAFSESMKCTKPRMSIPIFDMKEVGIFHFRVEER